MAAARRGRPASAQETALVNIVFFKGTFPRALVGASLVPGAGPGRCQQ